MTMTITRAEVTRAPCASTHAAVCEAVLVKMSVAPTSRAAACPASCSGCCLKEVCLPGGLDSSELGELEDLTRVKRRVAKGAALYRSGDAFVSLYALRSGSFKCVGSSRAGEEKVTGMHLPGDIMGLDAINTLKHGYDAFALEDSEVCVIPFSRLAHLAQRMPRLQAQLLRILSGDISRDRGLMLLLGAMDAEQRIAAFVLSLSRRYQRLGYAAAKFSLRMTREDIGSYLGLTLETVSRVFSRLQRDGLLCARQKDVELRNVPALQEKVGHW